MENEEMLTVQDAALELGVTDGTIRTALSESRLPFVEKYGRKLINRTNLEIYRQRTQPDGKKRIGRPRKARD